MKIIEPSVENITPNKYDIESIYKHIEKCARTCYKSTDKITEDSYKKFCGMLKTNKHLSTYEHGTIYLSTCPGDFDYSDIYIKYKKNPYSKVYITSDEVCCVTTNLRVVIENHWEDDLQYLCEPTEYHEKRYTFKVICGIDVSREWNRHRTISVSEQSTRYCNYSKEKFGGELNFIMPLWADKEIIKANLENNNCRMDEPNQALITALTQAEIHYMNLIELGLKPQDARKVLPLDTATEVIYTAFESDWKHFLSLRSSKAGATGAHPDIVYLANKIHDILTENEMAI